MDTYLNKSPDELFNLAMKFLSDGSTDNYYIHLIMAANLNHQPAIKFIINQLNRDKFKNVITQVTLDFLQSTSNYAWSSTFLARAYRGGDIVEKNYGKALELLTIGVNAKCCLAIHTLAHMYEYGLGVQQDYGKAFQLYGVSAAQKYAPSINNLGAMYIDGRHVKKNSTKAMELYTEAMDYGDVYAMLNIGAIHQNGEHVDKNLSEAERYYKLAHENGNEFAITRLVNLYKCHMNSFNPEVIVEYFMEHAPDRLQELNTCSDIISVIIKKWRLCQGQLDEQVTVNRQLTDHINLSPGGIEYLELLNEWNKKIDKLT